MINTSLVVLKLIFPGVEFLHRRLREYVLPTTAAASRQFDPDQLERISKPLASRGPGSGPASGPLDASSENSIDH